MSELTRADAIALYGNGERAWKRSEVYVEVDPRDLMKLCEAFLNTRPAPSPSREGWLTEERIRECRGDWLDALDGDFHSRGDSEFMVALCDMALSALRPAGDEGCLEPCECGEAWGHCKCAAPATKPTIHRDSAPDGCKWVTETKEDK